MLPSTMEAFIFSLMVLPKKEEIKMVKLEELLLNDRKVRFIVEDEDYQVFLTWAKANNCLWPYGQIIHPHIDKPDKSTKTIVVTNDKTIYHPHGYISNMVLNSAPRFVFKDIKDEIMKDLDFFKTMKLRESIKERQTNLEKVRNSYKEYIDNQRKTNEKQLRYQKYIQTFPKEFFVRYEDNDNGDKYELFHILEKYGYENIYNINPLCLKEEPKLYT